MARRNLNRVQAGGGRASRLPSRDDLLRFIAENPDRAGKREIAKAFGLKGSDRIWLKDMLRELQDEGLLKKKRRRLLRPGALPHVVVLDIFSRDAEGGLLARPAEFDGEDGGPVPLVAIRRQRAGRSTRTDYCPASQSCRSTSAGCSKADSPTRRACVD